MKKILTLICFGIVTLSYCQDNKEESFKKNEIKGNAISLVFGYPEFSYERLLNNESGVGVSIGFAADKNFDTKFTLSPYYRFYFGKKPAAGFFVEGFAMVNAVNTGDYSYRYYNEDGSYQSYEVKGERFSNFALGFGLGSKWITKKGFLFEINGGIGRNLTNSDKNDFYDLTIVGKGGITVGYRF
jgi:Protein of unknown function (DUF3575)